MLEANFTAVVNSDFTELSIQDTSTVDYDGENISSRSVRFTDADGGVEVFDFPLSAGVGDIYVYPLTKDIAITVEMELTPNVEAEGSSYEKVKALLIPNRLRDCLTNKRKELLHTSHKLSSYREMLEDIEIVSSYYTAAKDLVGTDIIGAQEALDIGNDLCNVKPCPCQ